MTINRVNTDYLKQRFNKLFPTKRLLAFRLDGFSHSLWYDDGNGASDVEQLWYSACAPESPHNTRESTLLLGIYPHYSFQGNAYGHVYVSPANRQKQNRRNQKC